MSEDWAEADVSYMREALAEANVALQAEEVPVGAVVVLGNEIIARAINRTVSDSDPTAHAEVIALRAAAQHLGNHRLNGATLYVTLEPCPMCAGALSQARIQRLVFGAYDEKAGSLGSAIDLSGSVALNHQYEVNGGLLAEESGDLLNRFFDARR